jgi:hypothetical protein
LAKHLGEFVAASLVKRTANQREVNLSG